MWSESAVAGRLRELTKTLRRSELFPTHDPEASELVATNPYAYVLAVSLNTQTKAEIIWTIPLDLQEELGHLDPARIARMSLEELDRIFRRLLRRRISPTQYNLESIRSSCRAWV
ncbi:MAG: hypothetical protein ACOC6F_02840 [bacterium]